MIELLISIVLLLLSVKTSYIFFTNGSKAIFFIYSRLEKGIKVNIPFFTVVNSNRNFLMKAFLLSPYIKSIHTVIYKLFNINYKFVKHLILATTEHV